MLTWKQGIFSDRIPRKFNHLKRKWGEIRMVILWSLWIRCNEKVFQGTSWEPPKLLETIWNGIVDYGRVDWDQIQRRLKKNLRLTKELKDNFNNQRCRQEVFATMVDGSQGGI